MKRQLSMITVAIVFLAAVALAVSAKEITIRGRLARTVEPGGWLVIADTDERTVKYLLLNPKRFQNESWFRLGAQVEVTGEVKNDVMTIYQEGVPFEARTMRSIDKATKSGRRRQRVW